MSEQQQYSRRTVAAGLGAVVAFIAGSSCCLPLIPLIFAAGSAGASAVLTGLRPWLLLASVLFIAYGFYQAWRAKRCNCQTSLLSRALLWISALLVSVSLLFPDLIANVLAG
jgi:hypothetical protein